MFQGFKKANPYIWISLKVEVKSPLSVLCLPWCTGQQKLVHHRLHIEASDFPHNVVRSTDCHYEHSSINQPIAHHIFLK